MATLFFFFVQCRLDCKQTHFFLRKEIVAIFFFFATFFSSVTEQQRSEFGMQSQTSKNKLPRLPSFGLTVMPPHQSAARAHSALSSMTPTGSVTSESRSGSGSDASDSDSCFDSWSTSTGDFTSESDSGSESGSSSSGSSSSGSSSGRARASNMRSHSLADMGASGSAAPGADTGPATPTSVEHLGLSRPDSPVYVPGAGEHFVPGSTRLSTCDSDSAPYGAWSSPDDSDSEDSSLPRVTARPRASSTIQPDQALQEPLFARYLEQHWEREDDLAAAAAAADAAADAAAPAAAAPAPAGARPKIPVMGDCEAKSPALMLKREVRRERHNSTNTCLVNNVIPAPIIEDLVHWFAL